MRPVEMKAMPTDGTMRPIFVGPGYQATPVPASAELPLQYMDLRYIDANGDAQRMRLERDVTQHPFNPDFRGFNNDATIEIAAYLRTEEWTQQKIMLLRITPQY